MIYPDTHPHAPRIKEKKLEIDALYSKMKKYEQDSREHYKFAMENLKAMGEDNRMIHDTLHEISDGLESLKGIIDSPTI